jgi:methylmalonyl-CoA mutase cobalamin-binding domain/chain
MPRIMELRQLMEKKNINIPIMVGGVIPARDAEELEAMGIKTFLPGTPIEEIETEGISKI